MKWKIIDTGVSSASKNMEIDAELLQMLDPNGPPILHFYDWDRPALTYGYFIKPADFLQESRPVDSARRPTGGGIVFHTWDLAFSVLIPSGHEGYSKNTLDNYDYINSRVLKAVGSLFKEALDLLPTEPTPLDSASKSFCMAKPTQYDVMMGSHKVAGAAQRNRAQGFLHQGSISLAAPDPDLLAATLLPGTRVLEAMLAGSAYILPPGHTPAELTSLRQEVQHRLGLVFA